MTEYGLILAGGGAKGSYQIGVWKALREMDVKICAVAGTSVGAINGAMIVQGDYDTAYKIWNEIDYNVIFNFALFDTEERAKMTIQDKVDYILDLIRKRGLDTHALRTLLSKYISEEKVRKSDIYYGLTTFSLTDMKPEVKYIDEIPEGQLIDYIMASAAFPLFQDHIINDKHYLDGGVYDNMPVSVLADKGIKDLIAVDLSAIGRVRKVDTSGLNITYIRNSQFPGRILQFQKRLVPVNIKVGHLDCLKAFNKVRGIRYYLTYQDNDFSDICCLPSKEEYEQLLKGLDITDRPGHPDRLILYRMIRRLKKYTEDDMDEKAGFIAAMEITADVLRVDRLKVYTLKSLVDTILKKYKELKNDTSDKHPVKEISRILWDMNTLGFRTEEIKNVINPYFYFKGIQERSGRHKILITGYPDLCIANIFIYLLLWRKHEITE